MDYIQHIFDRAQLPNLRAFLLDGVELFDSEPATYAQRLRDSTDCALEALRRYFPDGCEPLEEALVRAAGTAGEVYMEIGLQVGAMLVAQLLTPPR